MAKAEHGRYSIHFFGWACLGAAPPDKLIFPVSPVAAFTDIVRVSMLL
jgi:hypothetical protein